MSLRSRKALAKAFQANAHQTLGPIYRWLWEHHQIVRGGLDSQRAGWATVIAQMVEDSVTGRHGNTPTVSAVVRVWGRVCRDKAKAESESVKDSPILRKVNRSPRGSVTMHAPAPASGNNAEKAPMPFAPLPATPSSPDKRPMTPQEVRDTFRRGLENRGRPIGPRSAS